jgi:hypothetical protein
MRFSKGVASGLHVIDQLVELCNPYRPRIGVGRLRFERLVLQQVVFFNDVFHVGLRFRRHLTENDRSPNQRRPSRNYRLLFRPRPRNVARDSPAFLRRTAAFGIDHRAHERSVESALFGASLRIAKYSLLGLGRFAL